LRRIGYGRSAIIGAIKPEGNQIEPVSLIL